MTKRFSTVLFGSFAASLLFGLVAAGVAITDSELRLELGSDDVVHTLLVAASKVPETDGEFRFDAGTLVLGGLEGGPLRILDTSITVGLAAVDGRIPLKVAGKPFNQGSSFLFEGSVIPGAGRTGGHALAGHYSVALDDVRNLAIPFPVRVPQSILGALRLEGDVDGFVGEVGDENAPADPLRGTFSGGVDLQILGHRRALTFTGKARAADIRMAFSDVELLWDGLEAKGAGWAALQHDGKRFARIAIASDAPHQIAARFGLDDRLMPRGSLVGKVEFTGPPSDPRIGYQLKSDQLDLPGMGGTSVTMTDVALSGRIFDPYKLFTVSIQTEGIRIGDFEGGPQVAGLVYEPGRIRLTAMKAGILDTEAIFTTVYNPGDQSYRMQMSIQALSTRSFAKAYLDGNDPFERGFATVTALNENSTGVGIQAARVAMRTGELRVPNLPKRVLEMISPEAEPLVTDALVASFPETLGTDGTPLHTLTFDLQRDGAELSVGSLAGWIGRTELSAAGSIDADKNLHLSGMFSLAPRLLKGLEADHAWILEMADTKGWVHIPMQLDGSLTDPVLTLGEGVAERFAAVAAGEVAQPYELVEPASVAAELPDLPNYE
ncbi:MAG: hypothetical protein ACI8TX_002720 [Hyphomicrobiaceae bacterium]|jgi:hypothetical protein